MLGIFFDILCMGVFSTGHWQISGRLVQELNVCTVCYLQMISYLQVTSNNVSMSKSRADIEGALYRHPRVRNTKNHFW